MAFSQGDLELLMSSCQLSFSFQDNSWCELCHFQRSKELLKNSSIYEGSDKQQLMSNIAMAGKGSSSPVQNLQVEIENKWIVLRFTL